MVVATSFPLNGTEGIVTFVMNIIFIVLAAASFASIWWMNGISQGLNLAFLVYAVITSIAVKVYHMYQSSLQSPVTVGSSGAAEVDFVTGSILSGLNAFTGFVLFIDILFTLIWLVFCIANIVCFVKHTNLFYISVKEIEKDMEKNK